MKILGEKKPIDIFCEASRILNEAVEHTLGPYGTNTAVVNKQGHYEIINDGKAIIEGITSLEPDIAPALETLKQASFETNRKAGDGTTSTTVIMNALLQGAKEYMKESGCTPIDLKYILDTVKNKSLTVLDNIRTELTEDDYIPVATVALGGSKYADMISDVYKFLGKGKRPTLLKSDIDNIEIEKIDGVKLDKSKIPSSLFVDTSEHRDVSIICLHQVVNRFQEITQLLRLAQQQKGETLLFYNQLSTDILENILFNYVNGGIKVIPICLGGYGKNTFALMEELADYCDCNVIDETNCKVSEISKIKIGHIDYSVINSEQIVLKSDEKSSKNFEKNYVHLDEKSVIIRIGGTNVIEREEVYRRIEDAINSLGNAIEYGIVTGAGMTYKTIIEKVAEDLFVPQFIIDSMTLISNKLVPNGEVDKPIYDSAMVVKEVITNAFSIVSQVITTKVVIHENIR